MKNQKYKTTAMIADDLKAHRKKVLINNVLHMVGLFVATALLGASVVLVTHFVGGLI